MSVRNLLFTYILISILVILLYIINVDNWIFIGISIACLVLFLFRKEANFQIKKVYFRPIHIFLLCYLIVFFQTPIDYSLGYVNSWFELGETRVIGECLVLSYLGLVSFLVGYLLKKYKPNRKRQFNMSYNASTSIFAYLSTLFLILVVVTTPQAVLYGGYGRDLIHSASAYSYLSSWCQLFIIAFFVQHSLQLRGKRGKDMSIFNFVKSVGIHHNTNILFYFLLILNIGDRGPVLIVLTAYYISYIVSSGKTLNKKYLLISCTLAVIVLSILGQTKQFRDNNTIFDRISMLDDSNGRYDVKSISPYTKELAGSYKCLAFSVMNVPTRESYKYGQYQLSYILSAIPFSSRIIPTAGASSTRITYYIQGEDATYGNGSSCVADFYLDGGFVLVIIGMFLFGLAMRSFEHTIFCEEKPSLLYYSFAFYFCCYSVYISRSMVLFYFKYALWLFFVLYLFNKLFRNRINA